MPDISIPTLLLSIELTAREINALRQTIDDDDAVPEHFPRMDDLQDAALELEREYGKAAQTVQNLPPYDELVGR